MSYASLIMQAYKTALEDAKHEQASQAQRTKAGNQLAKATVQGVDSYLASQATPWASSLASAKTGALTGLTPAASTSAPSVGLGFGGSVPAYTAPAYSIGGAGGVTAGGTAATLGAGAGEAGAAGATAGSTAGSALSSTGVGAIIGAGLAIGSSSPGQTLFPAKKFMYNTILPVYNISGGYGLDKLLGKYSPRSVADWVFGNPNEQLAEYRRNNARAVALQGASRLSNINDKMQAWGQPEEMEVEG